MLNTLEGNKYKPNETGQYERWDNGEFKNAPGNGRDSVKFPLDSNTKGYYHVHTEPYKYFENGVLKTFYPQQMFSASDIGVFFGLLRLSDIWQKDIGEIYAGMISTYGNFEIRFSGNIKDIKTDAIKNFHFNSNETLKAYNLEFKKKDASKEEALLNFIKNTLGITGISLSKLEADGTVSKITLDANGKAITRPCGN